MGEAKRKRTLDEIREHALKLSNVPRTIENPTIALIREAAEATTEEIMSEIFEPQAKPKRREATIENLMSGQADPSSAQGLNVFPNMEAAWKDFVDHWVHVGLPDRYRDEALRLAFYVGIQSAANLMRYCEGQGEFNLASDQIQEEEVAFYQNEVKPRVDAAKADEWRTGEI